MQDEITAQLLRRLDAHSERLNSVEKAQKDIANIARRVEEIFMQANKNTKYLFGNGEPGLDERMRNVERRLADMIGALKWVTIVIGGYVILEVVKVIMEHL